ncbi:MAG: hypothetical protein OEY89_13180, partial [Gammaproteobacteria bacterium]|nr:hypothetical protein [Gammaproteobacteria bacterium]
MYKIENKIAGSHPVGTTDYAQRSETALRPVSSWKSNISFYGCRLLEQINIRHKWKFLKNSEVAFSAIAEMGKDSLLVYIHTARRERNDARLLCGLIIFFSRQTNAELNPDIWNIYRMYMGCAIDSPANERSIISLGIVAAAHVLYNQPVHIISHDEERLSMIKDNLEPVFKELGFISGLVGKNTASGDRREQYKANVCFCLSQELVFDYLRDRLIIGNMSQALRLQAEVLYKKADARLNHLVLRGLHVGLIESMEVVLIDEARKPLAITKNNVSDMKHEQSHQEQTLIRLSYPGFFRRYKNLAGFGLLNNMGRELWSLYRLPVDMITPSRYQMSDSSFRSIVSYTFVQDNISKWKVLLDEIRGHIGKKPCWVSIKSQNEFEQLRRQFEQHGIKFVTKTLGQDNLRSVIDNQLVTIIFNLADSMYIEEHGILFLVEYNNIQQVQRCKSYMAKQKNTSIECFLSQDDTGLNEVIELHIGLKMIKWLLVRIAGVFPAGVY